MKNNYTTEVIQASRDLILADCAFKYDFTPKTFKKLKERFNTAKTTFKESSNYLFLMREIDDESLLKQATEIYRTRNSADQLDDDEERNDFRSSHISTNK